MRTRGPGCRYVVPEFRYGIRVPTTEPHRPASAYTVELSKHLRDWMDERELSVERLAATMGRSRNYVYDHTNGLRAPDTDLINTVAQLTHTDARSLMMILTGRMGMDTRSHKRP